MIKKVSIITNQLITGLKDTVEMNRILGYP